MARANRPRGVVQCPPGISDARRRFRRVAAYALSQPRKYQRGSFGRAESHPFGNPRRDGRLVALARVAPSHGEPHARLVSASLASLHYLDWRSPVELPRNVTLSHGFGEVLREGNSRQFGSGTWTRTTILSSKG